MASEVEAILARVSGEHRFNGYGMGERALCTCGVAGPDVPRQAYQATASLEAHVAAVQAAALAEWLTARERVASVAATLGDGDLAFVPASMRQRAASDVLTVLAAEFGATL